MDTPLCLELYVAENTWLNFDDLNFLDGQMADKWVSWSRHMSESK